MSERRCFLQDRKTGAAECLPKELLQMAQETGGETVIELLGIFEEDSKARLKELYRAIVNEDSGAIQDEAHSLKGSAAQIGETALSGLCRQMERLAKTGTVLEQKALYEEIEAALGEAVERIPSLQAMAGESSDVS